MRRRLADTAGWAMLHIPAAGVDDEEAAIGILQHIGEMDVRILRGDEIEGFTSIRRTFR